LQNPFRPTTEFNDWTKFLDQQEQETMTLRFVEDWEYHEIAAAKAIPIGTVQWRVFNSKKKLASYLTPRQHCFARLLEQDLFESG
jgi:DNA-directed RNA polymerase specialized sigma24 family protein